MTGVDASVATGPRGVSALFSAAFLDVRSMKRRLRQWQLLLLANPEHAIVRVMSARRIVHWEFRADILVPNESITRVLRRMARREERFHARGSPPDVSGPVALACFLLQNKK
jgi:hypothetical protein